MKILKALALAAMLAVTHFSSQAQTNTNSGPYDLPQIFNFLSGVGTNLSASAYGLYDLTSKSAGGGVALDYKITPIVGAALRLDYLKGDLYVVQGTVNLEVPFKLGNFVVVPFAFAGGGTPFSGTSRSGDLLWVASAGMSMHVNNHWAILFGYEHWSGAGFNDDVLGGGLRYSF